MPSIRSGARAACGVVTAVLVAALPALAAEPAASRGGGLVPGSAKPRAGLTREELLREWDLDGDGTISKPEADVARGRMRRQRLDMQFGAGVDPITGLPRSIDAETNEPADDAGDELVFRLPPEEPKPPSKPRSDASPPGMRAPAPGGTEPTIVPPAATPAAPTTAGGPQPETAGAPAETPKTPLSSRASWLPTKPMAPATTGGVRAGAPAAVSGYGAAPWSGLNAGRRPPSQPAADGRPDRTAAGGGLVPAPRLPGRTGALLLPTIPGATVARPPSGAPLPTTPTVPQPQITAEEIGGYRP